MAGVRRLALRVKAVKTEEEEVYLVAKPVEKVHPVEKAARAYDAAAEAVRQYMNIHSAVFEGFAALASNYNDAISNGKAALSADEGSLVGVYTSEFSKGKQPTQVSYDLRKLPDAVLEYQGVLVVDKKVLEALAASHVVSQEVLAAARVENKGTASISKPAEIEIKIGRAKK